MSEDNNTPENYGHGNLVMMKRGITNKDPNPPKEHIRRDEIISFGLLASVVTGGAFAAIRVLDKTLKNPNLYKTPLALIEVAQRQPDLQTRLFVHSVASGQDLQNVHNDLQTMMRSAALGDFVGQTDSKQTLTTDDKRLIVATDPAPAGSTEQPKHVVFYVRANQEDPGNPIIAAYRNVEIGWDGNLDLSKAQRAGNTGVALGNPGGTEAIYQEAEAYAKQYAKAHEGHLGWAR